MGTLGQGPPPGTGEATLATRSQTAITIMAMAEMAGTEEARPHLDCLAVVMVAVDPPDRLALLRVTPGVALQTVALVVRRIQEGVVLAGRLLPEAAAPEVRRTRIRGLHTAEVVRLVRPTLVVAAAVVAARLTMVGALLSRSMTVALTGPGFERRTV